ncbi:MAG: MFS transporter, partial [Candidatus Cryptobacteroides sp.]
VLGAAIKFVGISEWFQTTAFAGWLGSWWVEMPASAKMASLGFMIFGCGCEMEGTNVSKILAKWFKGKEMALAMGLEMAIARLGVFAVMWIAPIISKAFGGSILAPLGFCGALLCIGLVNFIIFGIMDKKFDSQLAAAGISNSEDGSDEEFHISDLGAIFKSKMFWIVALLCVLYYSAIFPFQRYATNFLEVTLSIDAAEAARLFSCFPILAMCLTPFLGIFLDRVGKGASMLMIGSVIMIVCHLCFAFVLPAYPHKWFALLLIVVLGVSFSLVPAALWPSVPKIIDEKILGSAYCLIFWVQNIGLCFVPKIIGALRQSTGSYFVPMIVFASFGVLAFLLSLALKAEDVKKGYGLEKPNIQK